MKSIRAGARLNVKQAVLNDTNSMKEDLSYFVNEGLVIVRPELRQALKRILNFSKLRDDLTYEDFYQHFLNLSKSELSYFFENINDVASFMAPVGGAARDPANKYGAPDHHIFHSIFSKEFSQLSLQLRVLETPFGPRENKELASMTYLLYRMSYITLDDWAPVIRTLDLSLSPLIQDVFKPGLWDRDRSPKFIEAQRGH